MKQKINFSFPQDGKTKNWIQCKKILYDLLKVFNFNHFIRTQNKLNLQSITAQITDIYALHKSVSVKVDTFYTTDCFTIDNDIIIFDGLQYTDIDNFASDLYFIYYTDIEKISIVFRQC